MRFRNRADAGRYVAEALQRVSISEDRGDREGIVVLGLPRGGVPVAAEVARALGSPLDVIVVRKLGVPFQPELAMGAIGEDGVRVVNDEIVLSAGLGATDVESVERSERVELERRARMYRGNRPRVPLAGRCAVIVDDGVATGSSVRAACQVARGRGSARVVVAVPVASRLAVQSLCDVCDDMVCVELPDPFYAVGEWYEDFSQTTDEEVIELLDRAVLSDRGIVGLPKPGGDAVT